MDFGKHPDGTPKTFTEFEAEAMAQAFDDDAEKMEKATRNFKEGCASIFISIASHLVNAFLLMMVVALFGHPLGYLVCLLTVYTVSNIIGTSTLGEYLMLNKIYKQLGGK